MADAFDIVLEEGRWPWNAPSKRWKRTSKTVVNGVDKAAGDLRSHATARSHGGSDRTEELRSSH